MTNSFSGTIVINQKQYSYSFENFLLKIEWDSLVETNVGESPWEILKGSVANEPYLALFFLGPIQRTTLKSKGYSSYSVQIAVYYYVILKTEYCGKTMLKFKNKEFAKWLGVFPKHNVNLFEEKCKDSVEIPRVKKEQTAFFEYNKKHFEVFPVADLSYSPFDFHYMPSLAIQCHDLMDYSDLFDISRIVIDIIRFCFFRNSVDVGEICICCKKDESSPIGFEEVGSLYLNYHQREFEHIELNSLVDYGFIPWGLVFSHISSLVSCLERNDIFLYHLQEKKADRFFVNLASISSDASAFEYEFHVLFKNFQTAKKADKKYTDLRDKLETIELSEESNSILSDIISRYFDSPSLKEKAEYAIEQFSGILEPFFKFVEIKKASSKQIASDFCLGRNKVNHGSNSLRLSYGVTQACLVIRAIVICMQLRRIGMDENEIKSSLAFLFDRYVHTV